MNNTKTRFALATSTIVAAAALVACGGGSSPAPTPTPPPGSAMGTLSASLTDAPACGFDAVNVTVSKVRVHNSGSASDTESGWTDITLSPARKINLLNLTNGTLDLLGTTSLPAGKYNQVRLVLDPNTGTGLANSVVPSGGTTEVGLITPSAVQSGLKLNGEFEVVGGAKTDIVIDFDACKSITTKGKDRYALKPVVKLIPAVLNGIFGFVAPALLTSKVMVSAQQNGVVIASTVPSATGEFTLARLPAGNYDVVITADGRAATVIGAVPVATATTKVALSTTAAPITMPVSQTGSIGGTVKLAPVSATEVATVSAKQTFGTATTVTVKYANADLTTGAYTIAGLPLAAPQYAQYSATLPLVFSSLGVVTPGVAKYTVSASATGYATKAFATPVDITTGNATSVNLDLAP